MIDVRQFKGEQVILTGDRLIFNTKTDNVIISTKKDVSISAGGAIHMNIGPRSGAKADNNYLIINAPKIQLGLNNTEPMIKGDKAADLINKLLDALADLASNLTSSVGVGVGSVSEPTINFAGAKLQGQIQNIQALVNDIKSETSFTA